ncbi:MAG: hypothetical protein KDA21_11925, partial [Phycisphaerales bacterium]|nr:hypothetical protein [Phycisphaerales bacterium]
MRPGMWAALAAVVLGAGACSSPGPIFPEADASLRWPPPPDVARIAWVGELTSDRDLKPGSSALQSLGRTLFGREAARPLTSPRSVCSDDAGRVFVVDGGSLQVHVFDLASRRYASWRAPESVGFQSPVCGAWDPRGRLLVTDSGRGVVVV